MTGRREAPGIVDVEEPGEDDPPIMLDPSTGTFQGDSPLSTSTPRGSPTPVSKAKNPSE